MNKYGFIGYGHMGSVLLRGLLSAKAIQADQIVISTRSKDKLISLKQEFPSIEIAHSNQEVAEKSTTLFLCIGTGQVKSILSEIQNSLKSTTHLVTISGGLEISSIEQAFDGPITKLMPTLIAEVHEGVSLFCHNAKVSPEAGTQLHAIFSAVGKIKVIPEHQFEVCADFTSCAPGLLACICDQFVQAGMKHADLAYDEAAEMLLQTLYGTSKLLIQKQENFSSLVQRVATKGGATEGGTAVMETMLPTVLDQVFTATLARHEARKQTTRQQFAKTDA